MSSAAEALDFERAARLRDRLEAMETILVKNTMVLDDDVDADVFGLASDQLVAAAHVFRVRGGRIRSAKGFILEGQTGDGESELVEMILRDGFEDYPPAATVVVPALPGDIGQWRGHLGSLRADAGHSGSVDIRVAKRGELAQLAQTVALNAQHTLSAYLSSRTTDPGTRSRALAELQQALGLPEAPLRIECYDVSHLGGDSAVAAMVVFSDGLPQRAGYRKFALDSPRDDTDAIDQVLRRRLARLGEGGSDEKATGFRYPPGLLVVDGGLPQVGQAVRVLADMGLDIPVCGLAKKLEEVWLPGSSFPVILPRNSEALFLLQRIRDEAHRVAITYQRQTRKRTLTSELTDVPGVGPALAQSILQSLGSLARVKNASKEELLAIPGVGEALADKILAQWR
jgi:excinuclease ABC subunit C